MISPDDYRYLFDLLGRHSGLHLGEGKDYLLESRLTPIAEQFGLDDVAALVRQLRTGKDAVLVEASVEAMTTQETLFFRDGSPYKSLKDHVLPALVPARRAARQKLRIWSAACSTGQEPYSIAMLLSTLTPPVLPTEVEIFATDYSGKALARARAGLYSQFEVQRGLPANLLVRFFTQTPKGFEIAESVRKYVTFQEHNLLHSGALLGAFDIIFCRNVLIYFDQPVKRGVFDRLADSLRPGGFLFLGAAETPYGVTDRLMRATGPCDCPGVYVHSQSGARPHDGPRLGAAVQSAAV